MKIVYIFGNMAHYDHGLETVLKRTKNVFAELEAETEMIDLGALHPPYYDGETTSAMDAVMEKIKSADGLVFACSAQLFAPTALMQSFLEYLEHSDYADVLAGKHVLTIVLSRAGGEKSALDYLARTIQHFGGFAAAAIGLQAWHLSEIEGETGDFTDRTTEDFYRAVRKNRKYVVPMDSPVNAAPAPTAPAKEPAKPTDFVPAEKPAPVETFSDTQEQEIEELSELFTKKYSVKPATEPLLEEGATVLDRLGENIKKPAHEKPAPLFSASVVENVPSNPFAPTADEAAASKSPTAGTAQKLTESLPKFFQSQLSAGLQAVIQISITGNESFDGFLYIHSTECTYTEGTAPAPDIIIMADTAVWLDVLNNKNTAQKAFMIGGIKVRGDFVLLTKFDTLFKFPVA